MKLGSLISSAIHFKIPAQLFPRTLTPLFMGNEGGHSHAAIR